MFLKVGNDYLDMAFDIEIERQYMLIQDIRDSVGDFSYSFDIPNTSGNKSKLGLSGGINTSGKIIYSDLPCSIHNSSGIAIYRGFLRIDRVNKNIEASFFSGNTNWISAIEGNCLDLNLFDVAVEKTAANIQTSWANSSGLVFPLLDAGLLFDRVMSDATTFPTLYEEDFQGCVYGKTVFKKIFNDAGIKCEGELFNEFLFQNLVFTCNNVNGSQDLLNRRASRASKTGNQNVGTGFTELSFPKDSGYPDYNNGFFNTGTNEWTADVPMRVTGRAYVTLSASKTSYLTFRKNGAAVGGIAAVTGTENTATLATRGNRDAFYIDLAAGDVLTVEFRVTVGTVDVQAGSYVEITPIAFLHVVPQSLLGNLTKTEFVSSIFRMFNVIPQYNEYSKTITCNLFKKIKEKTPIEIKGRVIEEDYTTFISGYGKKTFFDYSEADIKEVEDYNALNDTVYGGGVIEIANSYLQDGIRIPIDFHTGFNYFNEIFGTTLTNHKFRELSEVGEELEISGVVTSGAPDFRGEFTTTDDHKLSVGDWVRIKETNTGEYVGSGKVIDVNSSTEFQIDGLGFGASITDGIAVKLELEENNSENVFALINLPNQTITNFSSNHSSFTLDGSDYSSIAYSYTNFPFNNLPINIHLYSIYFDNINIPGYNQVGLLQNYYSEVAQIFNDPVMLLVDARIPEADFLNISALSPIKFYHDSGYGLYYLNRITGYKNSYSSCEVELVKMGSQSSLTHGVEVVDEHILFGDTEILWGSTTVTFED